MYCAFFYFWAWRDIVWQWDVSAGAEAADVRAVLVLDAEDGPHGSAQKLAKGDTKGGQCRVLELQRDDEIHDPTEA